MYNDICDIKIIEHINLLDRCKCKKCQKEVELFKDVLEQRYNKQKVNKGQDYENNNH